MRQGAKVGTLWAGVLILFAHRLQFLGHTFLRGVRSPGPVRRVGAGCSEAAARRPRAAHAPQVWVVQEGVIGGQK